MADQEMDIGKNIISKYNILTRNVRVSPICKKAYDFKICPTDHALSQQTFTCSNFTIETLEKDVKYVQS